MAGVVEQIRVWAASLKYWEQFALEVIVGGKEITENDYQNLVDHCLHDAGLVQMPTSARPKLTFPREVSGDERPSYRLERLFNLRNVNALPSGQELSFGEHLTLVYGDNGAGKTGYTRPLANAAFARGDRDVLPNATVAPNPKLVPQVDIEVSRGGSKTVLTWTRGQRCPELAGCYVFDSLSLSAHLTRPNTLSFTPSGLSLLKRLAEVTDQVRVRLRRLFDEKDVPHNFTQLFPGKSEAATHIEALGAQTDVKVLDKLATLTKAEHSRIQELEGVIAQQKSQETPKRIASLKQDAKDLRGLLSSLAFSERQLGAGAVSEVQALLDSLKGARFAAERSGAERFNFDHFSQVGTQVWREFIEAAKFLADAERTGGLYPAEGDRCLLCRQPLSQDAVNLIRSLWEFLASDATARFEVAQGACSARIQELQRNTLTYFSEESGLRRTLNDVARNVVVEVQKEIDALSARRSELISFLGKEELQELTPLAPSRKDRISDLAKAWETEAASLSNEDGQKKIETLESELLELQHRRTLSEQLPAIKDHIKMKKWILRGRQSLGSTQHITSKHNELFKELVTDRFLESFRANLAEFNRNLKVTFQMHGHKGETMREIVLDRDAFPCAYPVDSILSESEKRAVALADFLTEAALDESCTAIILDDPVNSFDLNSRKIIARKFAELALTRQVVVFTHDLVFLYHIRAQAKALSVGVVAHWIQRGPNGVPGLVFLENSPVCEGDYGSAVQARERYSKAKSAVPTEQQWLLAQGFGALRTSYEHFIVFELLNGVVERFEERISFGRLADVSPDQEVVKEVIERMESVSRYIDAHLHSDSFAGEKPTPADLWAEIEAFESLRKKHKQRKKAVQQPGVAPKPGVGPQTQAPKDEAVSVASVSREAIELDQRTRLINQLRNKN